MWYITGPKLAQRAARHAWQGDGKEEKIPDAYLRAGDERYPLDVQDFLKLLRRKCGSVVRAWRMALDKDGGSELEFCEFVSAVRQMGSGMGQNARSLWFNLDVDQSGTLSLYDLDPIAAHALDKFRYLCTSRHLSSEVQVVMGFGSGGIRESVAHADEATAPSMQPSSNCSTRSDPAW